jgi:SAM-dependent methyltransferase
MDEYAAFAAIYDDWASHMTEDVPFYLELVREADGPVVELAVGNGRVAVPIAQATGKKIIGIDRSPAMLALAKEKAADAGVELELHEGDMRDFRSTSPRRSSTAPSAPRCTCRRGATSAVLQAGRRRARAPGGRFVWNSFVFNPRIAAANDGVWDVQHGIRHRVDHLPGDNRLDITLESGGSVSLWWVTKSEWEGLVDVSGLEVEALYGDFERAPFDEQSGEFVWVARKPR